MNTEKFRIDLKARLAETKRSVLSVCKEYNVQQASLSRFLADGNKQKQDSLRSDTVFALWPFVYGDAPHPSPGEARDE